MWVPSMLLDLDSDVCEPGLLMLETAQNHRILGLELSRELLLDLDLDLNVGSDLIVAVLLSKEEALLDLVD